MWDINIKGELTTEYTEGTKDSKYTKLVRVCYLLDLSYLWLTAFDLSHSKFSIQHYDNSNPTTKSPTLSWKDFFKK